MVAHPQLFLGVWERQSWWSVCFERPCEKDLYMSAVDHGSLIHYYVNFLPKRNDNGPQAAVSPFVFALPVLWYQGVEIEIFQVRCSDCGNCALQVQISVGEGGEQKRCSMIIICWIVEILVYPSKFQGAYSIRDNRESSSQISWSKQTRWMIPWFQWDSSLCTKSVNYSNPRVTREREGEIPFTTWETDFNGIFCCFSHLSVIGHWFACPSLIKCNQYHHSPAVLHVFNWTFL